MTDLRAALELCKPTLVERYESAIRSQFQGMVELHGPSLRGIHNCWQYARAWGNAVACYATAIERDWRNAVTVYGLDDAKLAAGAEEYAAASLESWLGKIEGKLGELTDAKVRHLDGATFRITGMRNGHEVEIIQTMIVNVSSKGTLYNQFPARIYVDGKATSEAKYKKL